MKSVVLKRWTFTALLLLGVKLNGNECFPTKTTTESWTSHNETFPTEPAALSEMAKTELPQPQFDQEEEEAIAVTDPEIPFVEDSTTTDVILLVDNNRDTEFSNSNSLSSSSEKELNNETNSIVDTTPLATFDIETTPQDIDMGGEELEQPTNSDITRPTNDTIIIEKNEIFNELNSIWYYTEELGEDQKDLKSSLSSLLDTTYERVHEQTGEVLGKLKHLLKRLRSRLLRQSDSVEAAHSEPELTKQNYQNHPNFSEVERETAISAAKSRQRRGTNLKERKITDEETAALFDNANLDENSLDSSEKSGSFSKKVNLTTFPAEKEEDGNFVSVTIYHPTNNTQEGQTDDKIAHPTMKETKIWDTKGSEPTLKPNAEFHQIPTHEFINYKKKYQIMKNKNRVNPTGISEEKNMTVSHDMNPSDLMIPTIENVIESIIGVLNTPIASPVATISDVVVASDANPEHYLNRKPYYSLPDYLSELTNSVGIPDLYFGNENETDGTQFLEVPHHSLKQSNSSEDLSGTSSSNEAVILTPANVVNGTIEKLYLMANTLARMPSPARFVMLFSIAISVASIGLGVYALGPPLIVMGVLGIIVPILLFLLIQNNAGKKKAGKEDILNKLKVEDFYQALDMIADAMIKYEKN